MSAMGRELPLVRIMRATHVDGRSGWKADIRYAYAGTMGEPPPINHRYRKAAARGMWFPGAFAILLAAAVFGEALRIVTAQRRLRCSACGHKRAKLAPIPRLEQSLHSPGGPR